MVLYQREKKWLKTGMLNFTNKLMNELIEIAIEIDRILKSGIEIMPDSPIHKKLQHAIDTAKKGLCPAWLDAEDFEFAKELYKENKLEAVKYLMSFARLQVKTPLKTCKELLEATA